MRLFENGLLAKFKPKSEFKPNKGLYLPYSDIIQGISNDYWVAVNLSFNEAQYKVQGVTEGGHMLIGTRTWQVLSDGCKCLRVETVGNERSANIPTQGVRLLLGGARAQDRVWETYLENIKAYWNE